MKKLAINIEENAFARGVLCFDDYNYRFHNQRILDGGKKTKGNKKDSRENLFVSLLELDWKILEDPDWEGVGEGDEGEENEESSSSDQTARESEDEGLKLENGEEAISKTEAVDIRKKQEYDPFDELLNLKEDIMYYQEGEESSFKKRRTQFRVEDFYTPMKIKNEA